MDTKEMELEKLLKQKQKQLNRVCNVLVKYENRKISLTRAIDDLKSQIASLGG